MNKKCFNMIEILLAMVVVSLGFMSVIGLLSGGLKAHRDAQENSYVTLAAETMANYIRGEAELYDLTQYHGYGSPYTINGFVNTYRMGKIFYFAADSWYMTAARDEARSGKYPVSLPPSMEFDELKFSKITLIPDEYSEKNGEPSFTLSQSSINDRDFKKHHYMKWITQLDGEEVVDFDCITTVGMSQFNGSGKDTGRQYNLYITNSDAHILLTIRVEWPAKAAPETRSKRLFHFYVY